MPLTYGLPTCSRRFAFVYLKRLEIQGFKTFATPTIFEFPPGITAVVGPNGSGKSNLVDAIRWVLGEQSFNLLRSKRTEDLIFGGGVRRAPAGFAEVALTIDNSDRVLPVPFNEVTLARRATRAGDVEYLLNRNRVRLRDIQEAVGPLGGSYTIITQGLVDAVLNLRPDERRRLFEDAAVLGTYEARRAETERRLRETDANVQRAADMLAELEPRQRSLKRQAGLARSHRDLSAELHTLQLRYYRLIWQAAQDVLAATQAAEQRCAAELADRQAAVQTLTDELHAARADLRLRREHLGSLHAKAGALHTQAEAAQRELAVYHERVAALERQDDDQRRALDETALRADEVAHEQAAAMQSLAEEEAHLQAQNDLMAALEAEQATEAAERRAARGEIERSARAELEAEAALTDRRRRAQQSADRRTRLLHEQAQAEAEQQRAETEQSAAQAALSRAEHLLELAGDAARTALQGQEQARTDLEAIRRRRLDADEALAQCRRALGDQEARYETLSRLHQSDTGTSAGVRAALQWARSHQLAGVVLVSSILQTPAHLETALETALGARLQQIVVERWQDAEDAIVALKRGEQGRATFLPLDTVTARVSDLPTDLRADLVALDPESDLAANLVSFDERYRSIVWMLLGRTLVIRDLPAARQALDRIRMRRDSGLPSVIVTLSGEQLQVSGALTGGAAPKEGGSGMLRRERELRELPEQIAAARTEVAQAQAARTALDQALSAAERSLHDAEQMRRRAEQDAEIRRTERAQARQRAERTTAALDLQQRRRQQITLDLAEQERLIAALNAEQVALHEQLRVVRARHAELRAAEQSLLDIQREQQTRLETVRAERTALTGRVSALRATLNAARQQSARLEQQRQQEQHRLAALEQERRALVSHQETVQQRQAVLHADLDQLRNQIAPAEQELAACESALLEQERQLAEHSDALRQAEHAATQTQLEYRRAQDRRTLIWERAADDDLDLEALPPTAPGESQAAPEALQADIQNLRLRIQRLGPVNPLALEEYAEVTQRYEFLSTQIDDLRRAAGTLGDLIGELDLVMQQRFEATFRAVASEFAQTFTTLFGGGQAQLLLTRPEDTERLDANGAAPLETFGIDILARPPGKRQQPLVLLSGGERSLTAIALLFALLKVNPAPFCVLDEVDAALDESNVGRFRAALAGLTARTQSLIVTHNRGTLEVADTIYGVAMSEAGVSKVVSLRLEEVAKRPDAP